MVVCKIDFNGMATTLGLFYAKLLKNRVPKFKFKTEVGLMKR